jgi:uncharacterized protein YerC
MTENSFSHYENELEKFIDAIDKCLALSNQLEQQLNQIISYNTIVGIAARVEVQQLLLDRPVHKFQIYKDEAERLKRILTEENLIAAETVLTGDIAGRIDVLSVQIAQTLR